VIAACKANGISITAYSPIVRGKAGDDPVLAKIGRAHRKSVAQVCLRFLAQQGMIAIPRTSKVERLTENSEIFNFELSPAEMLEIRGLARPDGRMVNPSWAPEWDQ
jgi:2,5-diketo-D-gluconate reductase B